MATLTFDPTMLSGTIRFDGGAYSPADVRAVSARAQTRTEAVTVTAAPLCADIALAKVGSASWLTCPAVCQGGVAFDLVVDAAGLKAGNYSEVIRASKAGYDSVDLPVTLAVRPMGPKP